MSFTSSPRGARLARRLVVGRLEGWGYAADTAALLVGELTANAVAHGHVPGREFRVRIAVLVTDEGRGALAHAQPAHRNRADSTDRRPEGLCAREPAMLRIEVSDAATEHPILHKASEDEESGRGLFLIDALATAWGSHDRSPGIGKTVWAECVLRPVDPVEAVAPAPGTQQPSSSA
ncbi:ATP-binding protein [Streptomyces sp. bgisy100]|uniref:ATP-binding protein n=1 Tax=Streptomyces sp. bgisy100 TaxID=3413783 RepID=UPI003D764EF7